MNSSTPFIAGELKSNNLHCWSNPSTMILIFHSPLEFFHRFWRTKVRQFSLTISHSVATLARTSVTWKVCYYPWCFLIWAPNPHLYCRDSKDNVNYYFITVFFLNILGKAFWLDELLCRFCFMEFYWRWSWDKYCRLCFMEFCWRLMCWR